MRRLHINPLDIKKVYVLAALEAEGNNRQKGSDLEIVRLHAFPWTLTWIRQRIWSTIWSKIRLMTRARRISRGGMRKRITFIFSLSSIWIADVVSKHISFQTSSSITRILFREEISTKLSSYLRSMSVSIRRSKQPYRGCSRNPPWQLQKSKSLKRFGKGSCQSTPHFALLNRMNCFRNAATDVPLGQTLCPSCGFLIEES